MNYKIGDYVIIIEDYKERDCIDEFRNGKDLKNHIGKIVSIDTFYINLCYIEIINCPYKKECKYWGLKGENYCHSWFDHEIKSINSLKLEKFIKHGV